MLTDEMMEYSCIFLRCSRMQTQTSNSTFHTGRTWMVNTDEEIEHMIISFYVQIDKNVSFRISMIGYERFQKII